MKEPASPAAERSGSMTLPVGRKVLYATVATVLSLVLLLVVAELTLKLADYGHAGTFFSPTADGHLTSNPHFPYRYFGKSVPPRDANWVYLAQEKPVGTYRIFILGGSAAQGVPSTDFHFGRFLEVLLARTCPKMRFEVHNLALTAINSHVVRDIAEEAAEYEPDLMILYLGNNEVVGPFGPGSVFEGIGENLGVLRTGLMLKNTRLGQWLTDLAPTGSGPSDWEGLRMFLDRTVSRDDPRLARVYEHLQANLTAICQSADQVDAKVLLGTVAVNLKDCPPFASSGQPDPEWIERITSGGDGAFAEKWIPQIRAALAQNPQSAMLHYLLGRCLLTAGDARGGRENLAAARDLDLLRFRADSRINQTIRKVADQQATRGVQLVDVERYFAEHSPAATPGEDYFYEHVHFNPRGQYELARAFLPKVLSSVPEGACETSAPAATFAECAQQIALTELEYRGILKATLELIDKPPFTDQLLAEPRVKKLQGALEQQDEVVAQKDLSLEKIYLTAVQQRPDDPILRKLAGRFLLATGRPSDAYRQYEVILEAIPESPQAMLLVGEAAYGVGDYRGARERFEQFIEASPDRADALSQVAGIYLREGEHTLALDFATQAYALRPDRLSILNLLSRSQLAAGQKDEAYRTLRRVGAIRPDDPAVRRELARAALQRGDFPQAALDARACLKERSGDVPARLSLAMALGQLQQHEAAMGEYQQLLERRPIEPMVEKQFLNFLRSNSRDQQAFDWCRSRIDEADGADENLRVPLAEMVVLQSLSRDPSVYDPDAALAGAERLQRFYLTPHLPAIELLAMAQAENNQFAEARKSLQKALALATQQRDRQAVARLQQQLKWIEQKKKPSELQ